MCRPIRSISRRGVRDTTPAPRARQPARPTAPTPERDTMTSPQDKYADAVRQGQQAMTDAVESWTDSAQKAMGSMGVDAEHPRGHPPAAGHRPGLRLRREDAAGAARVRQEHGGDGGVGERSRRASTRSRSRTPCDRTPSRRARPCRTRSPRSSSEPRTQSPPGRRPPPARRAAPRQSPARSPIPAPPSVARPGDSTRKRRRTFRDHHRSTAGADRAPTSPTGPCSSAASGCPPPTASGATSCPRAAAAPCWPACRSGRPRTRTARWPRPGPPSRRGARLHFKDRQKALLRDRRRAGGARRGTRAAHRGRHRQRAAHPGPARSRRPWSTCSATSAASPASSRAPCCRPATTSCSTPGASRSAWSPASCRGTRR